MIAKKLENTLALDYPREKLEIVVASDGSTDGTHEVVSRFAGRGVRLFVPEGHLGKTGTANAAVPDHAGRDPRRSPTPRACTTARRCAPWSRSFADPRVGAVTGRVLYRYDESVTARGFAAYQRLVVPQRRAESVFGTETSVSGSIHAAAPRALRAGAARALLRHRAPPPRRAGGPAHRLRGRTPPPSRRRGSAPRTSSAAASASRCACGPSSPTCCRACRAAATACTCSRCSPTSCCAGSRRRCWRSRRRRRRCSPRGAAPGCCRSLALARAAAAAALGWLAARLGRSAGPFAAALVFADPRARLPRGPRTLAAGRPLRRLETRAMRNPAVVFGLTGHRDRGGALAASPRRGRLRRRREGLGDRPPLQRAAPAALRDAPPRPRPRRRRGRLGGEPAGAAGAVSRRRPVLRLPLRPREARCARSCLLPEGYRPEVASAFVDKISFYRRCLSLGVGAAAHAVPEVGGGARGGLPRAALSGDPEARPQPPLARALRRPEGARGRRAGRSCCASSPASGTCRPA